MGLRLGGKVRPLEDVVAPYLLPLVSLLVLLKSAGTCCDFRLMARRLLVIKSISVPGTFWHKDLRDAYGASVDGKP